MKKLFLVDGTAQVFKSYFAYIKHPLINKDEMDISAIYGVINTFISIVKKHRPDYIMITFDRKEKTFRHKLDASYKANRPAPPDALQEQFDPIKSFFPLLGLSDFSVAGYEADDIIGTFVKHYKDQAEIYIISGDKDFAQLIDENVYLYEPQKDVLMGKSEVKDKYGINVEQFIDYLAIVGDSADNIPGVKGVGPKGASKLLNEYGSLMSIYENIDKIKGSTQTKLINSQENALHSYKMAKIEQDIDINLPQLEDLVINITDEKPIFNFFLKYDLQRFFDMRYKILDDLGYQKKVVPAVTEEIDKIRLSETDDQLSIFDAFSDEKNEEVVKEVEDNKREFTSILVKSTEELREILSKNNEDFICFDTETTSLNTFEAELVGISFCFSEKESYYVPLGHFAANNLEKQDVMLIFEEHFSNKILVGHNIKYDLKVWLHNFVGESHIVGINFDMNYFDTMIASFIVDASHGSNSLDSCMLREYEYVMQSIVELIGSGKKQRCFNEVEVNQACFYAAEDAWATYKLYQLFQQQIEELGLSKLYYDIEMKLLKVIIHMEETGTYIDTDFLKDLSKRINSRLNELVIAIYELAGHDFNLNSPKQLGEVLFNEMSIPPVKKTKTGYSTNYDVLVKLAPDYEIVRLMLEYRTLNKLETTYVSALPKLINKDTQRVHSNFNQIGASTGRLSSSNPNLQNIPIRSEMGGKVREAFIAQDEEWVILAADYSQIELRLLAIFSQDPILCKTFNDGGDIHRETAALIYDKLPEDISKKERASAKSINFGIIYGMGAKKLAKEIGVKVIEAKEFIDDYFEKFPTIGSFIETMIKKAKSLGYCETITGRRLLLSDINSSNKRYSSEAERVAVNMPIQGSAADIIKIAMINIHEKIKNRDDVKMEIQVHDELVFEVKKSSLSEIKTLISEEMEGALPENYRKIVRLRADIGVGDNWLEAH